MCIIDCLSTIVFILPLHLDYTKVIILILWWRNFQLEYWRIFQLVSTDRLIFFEKLMQYVIPKQASQQVKLDFESLTDEQLQQIINDLIKDTEYENTD